MNYLLSRLTGADLSSRRRLDNEVVFNDIFSSPDQAAPRNLTTEMQQTLAGYQSTAPGFLALNQQFQPAYGRIGLDQQRQSLYGYDDANGTHHPGTLELGRYSTEFQRAGDISDVAKYGPASTEAFLAANPWLRSGLNQTLGRMQDSDILKTLNTQANTQLAGNGQLSPQEQRALDQQSRSAFSQRGNLFGNQSIATELLNRDAAVRARQQQAQQFATGVQGLNQAQNDFVGRGTQIFGTTLSDPYQAVIGRGSGAAGSGSGSGYPQTIGTGSQLFDPLNPYAQDVYSSNFNAQNANNIAKANASNAQTSAYISAAGSVLGALLSDKRLKKNIKKTGDETEDGIPIVEGEYKTDDKHRKFRFVLAQDVEKVRPDAVLTDKLSGVKAVKYDVIDAPFQEVRGKGKKARYFNLITGELEEAA